MTSNKEKPVRILHVLGGMNPGGVETWLMRVLRHIDRNRFQMDFMVHTKNPCSYDDEIRATGRNIFPCPFAHQPLKYIPAFKRILRENGPYDIVHSHLHHYSGFVLRLAKVCRVPKRVSHSHNDMALKDISPGYGRHFYLTLMKKWIDRYSTNGLACSDKAAVALFGQDWKCNSRWEILRYGVELPSFLQEVDSPQVRKDLNIPRGAFVLGHVGRFDVQKNHTFLIDIVNELVRIKSDMRLLLVGEGPLRKAVEKKAEQVGISDKIIFTGHRSDIPRLMVGAMDAFILPSHYEGLPLVLVEAQAAGLPCIISDVVSKEADIVKPLVRRLSLSSPALEWAETVKEVGERKTIVSRAEALTIVKGSPFNITSAVRNLEEFYRP